MKVKEIIQKLQKFDPEAIAVVGGFDEDGYASINRIQLVPARDRVEDVEIFGEYIETTTDQNSNTFNVVLLEH